MSDYLEINRASWDERAPAHAASPDYAVQQFIDDPSFLSGVVRFDLPRLGDVSGLRGVHLQCHIATDTVSLARLGASMVGVDFSPASLAEGRRLVEATGADVTLVESDVYGAVEALGGERFELLYTGIGALCWLPSIVRWADVVAALLAPGGRLFVREGHPMLWAIDERITDRIAVELPYFERPEAIVWDDEGETYVQTDVEFEHRTTHVWNHGLGETVAALLARGFRLTELAEHDSVPWEALPGRMEDAGGGEFRLADRPWRLAHSYTLQAVMES
jgi:SAM-dependent methyltransferase